MNSFWKRIACFCLAATLLMPALLSAPAVAADPEEEFKVYNLKVCETDQPLGVDAVPTFSWELDTAARDAAQSAYRIIVASSEEKAAAFTGDVWDSGKTEGENNYDITYAGPALSERTGYYWCVEAWDNAGHSARSAVGFFLTGIWEEDSWKGDWIGTERKSYDLDMTGANWIWKRDTSGFGGSPAGTQYMRKTFTPNPDKTIREVLVGYTADDQTVFYFNGTEQGSTSSWSTGGLFDATASVKAGANVVAIAGTNTSDGYAGLLSKIMVRYADGTEDVYVSDASWKVSDKLVDGWYAEAFDDSAWSAPTQSVSFGSDPWGTGVSLEKAGSRAAVTLRKEFAVDKKIASAYAYVCGLGFFDFTVNGKQADDTLLNPCNTQYDQTALYRVFDVTDLLSAGRNAVGVELGNSFYNEIGGVWNWPSATWRDEPKLLFNLDIHYTDGTVDTVASDTSWKLTKNGPTISNGVYYGDSYDARKELTGFNTAGYDDSAWTAASVVEGTGGRLSCQLSDPVRRTSTFTVKSITRVGTDSYVVATPEMTTGWIKLMSINASAGDRIAITYGEKLNSDGTVQKLGGSDGVCSNWWPHAYNQQDIYISAGKENESFEPKFSYKGFQYVQIDGYPGELTADDLEIYRVSNDVAIASEIETSNTMVNQLHKLMRTTLLNNFQGKPTDTPVWEKNGWLGDANAGLLTMLYNFDMSNYLPNFIEIMEDCFNLYGTVPDMVPTAGWWLNGNAAVWNTIYVIGTAELWNTYGMENYTEVQYDSMRQFALKDMEEIEKNGWVWVDGQLSDWCSPVGGSNPDVGYNEGDSEGSRICGTAFVYKMLSCMKDIAENLGKTADAKEYADAMANIYTAFNQSFYNKSKGIYETGRFNQVGSRTEYRQTSNLAALAFGFVPEEYVETVVANLVKDIEEKNYHLDTGVVGTRLILPVLCDYGYSQVAYRILTQDTYPSWGYWLSQGATSAWEMWEKTSRSLDHYFLGTYDEWLYSHLAGITDAKDGYKTFTIHPYLVGDIDYVNASLQTVRGKVESNWSLNADGTATMKLTVPVGSTATVYFPTARTSNIRLDGERLTTSLDGVKEVSFDGTQIYAVIGSGEYSFTTGTDLTSLYTDSLAEAIKTAEAADMTAIPEALVKDLNAAIAAGKATLAKSNAVQHEINAAAAAIEAALAATKGSEARIALRKAVAAADAAAPAAGIYSAEAYAAYTSALLTARKLAENYDVPDAQLITAKAYLQDAIDALGDAKLNNRALGAKVTASSTHEDTYWNWGAALMTDGDTKNVNRENDYTGYCSNLTTDRNHAEWVAVDLGEVQLINNVTIYAACANVSGEMIGYGMPIDFTIQVSEDNQNWKTVHTETNYPLPGYGPQSFSFEDASARYVKLDATSLRPKGTEGNSYRMQFSELEVYRLDGTAGNIEALTYLELDGVVLNEVFKLGQTAYTANVSAEVSQVTLTPYTTEGAAVKVNGEAVSGSAVLPLSDGENVITVTVGGVDTHLTVVKEAGGRRRGDIDGDGKVTVSDVVELRKQIVNGTADRAICDLDGDSKVTVSDVVELRKIIVQGA